MGTEIKQRFYYKKNPDGTRTKVPYFPLTTESAILTSDGKKLSTKMAEQLSSKVDKVTGKGLSTNDYTNEDKSAVQNIAELSTSVGTIGNLTTSAKTDLVSAINEVNSKPSGGGEPSAYIKSASVSGNTLTLTNKDNTSTSYTPTITTPTWADIKPTDGIALADLTTSLQTSISRADEIYNDYVSAQNLI